MFRRGFEDMWTRHRGLIVLALFCLLAAATGSQLWGAPIARSADEGQTLFEQRCVACHTIGGGKLVGPDLKGVTARRDRAWLVRFISAPDQVLAQKDPIATQLLQEYGNVPMPNLGLTNEQVTAIITYLGGTAGGAAAPAGQAAAQPMGAGDPVIGKDLFIGSIRFQNGGPPCMACHSIAGIGALGGGALGPDLTGAFGKFGDTGINSVLATLPFPTMNPIFGKALLTADEQASLKAFFQAASVAERPAEAVGQLSILAVVGAAILILIAHLFFSRRLAQVRRPMVSSRRLSAISHQPPAVSSQRPTRR
ncbi:MAG: cytochrome c [Dehalococcoidia bacterium]|nr:cytochrome c [Dehalococcoidia bacterium]